MVNSGVLVLLGISGATYALGKSLDRTAQTGASGATKDSTSSSAATPTVPKAAEARTS
ncbi:MAG TPA: hypothetical protein VHW01_11900 [Polyangiaceae bacterium]|nr:hypothetical protein [Polyangiaceae bacterium]